MRQELNCSNNTWKEARWIALVHFIGEGPNARLLFSLESGGTPVHSSAAESWGFISVKDTKPVSHLIRFQSFEVNLRSGELRKDGKKIKLPEQSFQILAMLLERPYEVVMRAEIQKRLWPNDTVVEFENSIHAAVRRLRLALGDPVDAPRYIETLARRGYRWMLPVEGMEVSLGGP